MEGTTDKVLRQAEKLAGEVLKHLAGELSAAPTEHGSAEALLDLVAPLVEFFEEHKEQLAGLAAPSSSSVNLRRLYCTALPAHIAAAGPGDLRLAFGCLRGLGVLCTTSEKAAATGAVWNMAVTVDGWLAVGDSEELRCLRVALMSVAYEALSPDHSHPAGAEPEALGPESPALLPLYRLALGALQQAWSAVAAAVACPCEGSILARVASRPHDSVEALVSELSAPALVLRRLLKPLFGAWEECGGMDMEASLVCCCAMAEALAGIPHSPPAGKERLYGAALRAIQSILRLQQCKVLAFKGTGGAIATAGVVNSACKERGKRQQQQQEEEQLQQEWEQYLVQQKRPWMQTVRFVALALHHAADGSGGPSIKDSGSTAIWHALRGLDDGGWLVCQAFVPTKQQLVIQSGEVPTSFPAAEEDVGLTLETAEALARLAAKRAALDPLMPFGEMRGHALPTILMMVAWQLFSPLCSRLPSSSQGQGKVWLQQVQSLCATAAKLGRCLPSIDPVGPGVEVTLVGKGDCRLSPMALYQLMMESAAKLALTSANITAGARENLSGHLRRCGFLAYLCIPALLQVQQAMQAAGEVLPKDIKDDILSFLLHLCDLQLMDLAVRGGLGGMFQCRLRNMLGGGELADANYLIVNCALFCKRESGASLSIALVKDGVLDTLIRGCYHLMEDFRGTYVGVTGMVYLPYDQDVRLQLLLTTVVLLRAVCEALDAAAGTQLLEEHAAQLSRIPSMDNASQGLDGWLSFGDDTSWGRGFLDIATWERVYSELLPALVAACAPLVAAGEPLQNDIFREVSVAAVCCSNPACANMAGAHEADVRLSPCGSCMEARYCSKSCQRADWRRHKPICIAIKELK